VISSPSGGGKTTVIQKLMDLHSDFEYAVSATTRKPRGAEQEGVDYYFITKQEFENKIREQAFLEWAEVHGHFYGTLKSQVVACMEQGRNIILDIDVQGGLSVKQQIEESVLIFLMPPSIHVLEKRLRSRGTDDGETIRHRLNAAAQEIKAAEQYDYIVFNHEIDQAVQDIQKIIIKASEEKL